MENKNETSNQDNNSALHKTNVSGSSITDIIYGIGIFFMLLIILFGAVIWSLGY